VTTIRPTGDDKEQHPQINIHIHIHPEVDPDDAARRIIKLINDYRRRHGGQDPFG
jgi:hypothetical protein